MPAKITILICLSLLASFFSCSTPKDQEAKKENHIVENTMKGKIISETFVNKGGKEISTIHDLFFETDQGTYFIKFMDSNISYEEAAALINQSVTIEGEIRDGFWDVPDDNPQYAQSRTGPYLVINKIY